MATKGKIKTAPTAKKPKRNFLLLEFSALSFIVFIGIGFLVITAIKPALESFVLDDQKNTTVVFANKLSNRVLSEDDFHYPLNSEEEERMGELFIKNLNIRGVVRIFVTDSEGTIIYAQPRESIGASLAENTDVKFALERRRATAHFEDIAPAEQEALGVREALIEAVPLTFGASEEVSGVVYIISRVGLMRKQITETEELMTVRIVGGLLFLYFLLFIIVWRASRTIRTQARELASYAATLEQRVRDRTRDLEESTKKQIAQAKELARLKDEFVFIAAHELKAPVTSLRWVVGDFLSHPTKYKKNPSKITSIMEQIQGSTDALVRLVGDLLNVARLESGTVTVSVHPTDLVAVVEEIILQFKIQQVMQLWNKKIHY